jgi:hypothetical protein
MAIASAFGNVFRCARLLRLGVDAHDVLELRSGLKRQVGNGDVVDDDGIRDPVVLDVLEDDAT